MFKVYLQLDELIYAKKTKSIAIFIYSLTFLHHPNTSICHFKYDYPGCETHLIFMGCVLHISFETGKGVVESLCYKAQYFLYHIVQTYSLMKIWSLIINQHY